MPHLALPSLTAYLRAAGVHVIQRDLNAEVFDHILSREYLAASLDQVARLPARERGVPTGLIQWARQHGPDLIEQVEPAKTVIRSPEFYDGETSLPAFETVLGALRLASLSYFPATLELQTYNSAYRPDQSASIFRAVRDRDRNMFIEIFERIVIPDILREDPDVVGISIPCVNQVIAAMTLAHLIKRHGARAHLTIGGPMVSIWREQLLRVPQMFDLFDSAVIFDGEQPLLELCGALEHGRSLSTVPNLVFRGEGKVVATERAETKRIAELPPPDFHGLPLDRYLAPELVLPLAMARGCYFGKCAFCNVGYGEAEVFSQMRGEQLLEQMLAVAEEYQTRRIFFVDEAMPPRIMRSIAPRLAELGVPVRWGGCMRFEKVLGREFLVTSQNGGCCMILFGLEAASQKVMDLMVKGTHLDVIQRVLADSHDAGIWNHTFFFFGFPGETIEDAQETVNFLYRNGSRVNSAAMGTFLLERYAPAYSYPKAFGIKRVIHDPTADLGFYFDYEPETGMDAQTAELVATRLEEALPKKQFPQFYVSDVYRFLYAAHLNDQRADLPPWIGVPSGVGAGARD